MLVLLSVLVTPLTAQGHDDPAVVGLAAEEEHVRVFFPPGMPVDDLLARAVVRAVCNGSPVAGIPEDKALLETLTIRLSAEAPPGIDGQAYSTRNLIMIPLSNARAWEPGKLDRVVQHELAHLALEIFLDYERPPLWFGEGFSEWASGGLTCEGRMRVHEHLSREDSIPRITWRSHLARSRIAYDFYTTFFEFLDARKGSSLRDGTLVASLKGRSVVSALELTYDESFTSLEEEWRRYLSERYHRSFDESSCQLK